MQPPNPAYDEALRKPKERCILYCRAFWRATPILCIILQSAVCCCFARIIDAFWKYGCKNCDDISRSCFSPMVKQLGRSSRNDGGTASNDSCGQIWCARGYCRGGKVLVCDCSEFITGTDIKVDGGLFSQIMKANAKKNSH